MGAGTGPAADASRILHLLVINILTVGLAMRLGGQRLAARPPAAAGLDETQPDPEPALAHSAGLGISAAGALARLTSHSR